MAGYEPPSFSLGLNLGLVSKPQIASDKHPTQTSAPYDEDFGIEVMDSDPESQPEPPWILKRLKQGPTTTPTTKTSSPRVVDNDIENFSSEDDFLKGVVYDIDAEDGMAYITGKVDPHKILKKLVKSGKHAQLCWVEIGNQYTYSQDGSYLHPRGREPYYEDPYPYLSSYRRDSYWDGYNGPGYNSYYPHQPMPHYYTPQVPYNPYYC
nr:hypothetical protein CFP56_53908 [Quercus suber]